MITQRQYKIYHEEGPIRIAYDYTDTYFLGLRIKRTITETGRRGIAILPELRHIVERIDAEECVYCGWSNQRATHSKQHRKFSIDHIIPQVQGGESTLFNLVWCCGSCNSSKGGRTPAEAGLTLIFSRYWEAHSTLPMNRLLFENRNRQDWLGYVRNFHYGPLFNDPFIACDGLIPFMRHLVRVVPSWSEEKPSGSRYIER